MRLSLDLNQFEDILLDPNRDPYLYHLLLHHCEVELNLDSQSIRNMETDTHSILFHFIKSTGGRLCNAFRTPINWEVSPNYMSLLENEQVMQNGGLPVEPTKTSHLRMLKRKILDPYAKEKPSAVQFWSELMKGVDKNSNAMVINDPYIFSNDGLLGVENLATMLNYVLPEECDLTYHIFIMAGTKMLDIRNSIYKNLFVELVKRVTPLRDYSIQIELAVGEAEHNRKLYTNHLRLTPDKGFKLFGPNGKGIPDDNELTLDRMFTTHDPSDGDTQYADFLKNIRKIKFNATKYIANVKKQGNKEKNLFYTTFTENPYQINNRLFNLLK